MTLSSPFVDDPSVVSLDVYETNDMLAGLRERVDADIDDASLDELTHQVVAAFEEAQRRTARTQRFAATVGADMSTAARAVADVGEKLGLKFAQDPHVDFDDWQADIIGSGRAVVISPSDPNRITFVGADGQHYIAGVTDTGDGGAPSWPRFNGPDGGEQWIRLVRPSIDGASRGESLQDMVDLLEGS